MGPPAAAAADAPASTAAPAYAELDAAMEKLSANKAAWAAASLDDRIAVLKEIRGRLIDQLIPWSRAAAGIRCTQRDGAVAQETVLTVTVVGGQLDGFIRSLEALRSTGALPRPPAAPTSTADQTVLDVFPQGWRERWLNLLGATGLQVQLYLQPGKPDSQGHFYRQPHAGKLAVVLGAGNQHHLALSDALHMAVVEGCAVMLKYHPLMAPVAPYIDYVMEPLASRGAYASSTVPDLAATQRLLYSPLTDCVHMTGGTATHDAIVWGSDPAEQARRRAANDPLLKVPITSELGCVTPWLVVPGPWEDKEIQHHARALAEGLASNCSCNCLAPKVIMLAEEWPQADAFVAAVKAELAAMPQPAAYYPGIRQRYEAFQSAYPQAEAIASGQPADPDAACGPPLPFLINELPSWPADPSSEYAFRVEPFAPVLTFVRVPAVAGTASVEQGFMSAAVKAANEHLWGTLSCTLLVHPATEAAHGPAVRAALDGLQYGTVALNAWSALGFAPAAGGWGGFQADQSVADVGSGIGVIHNCYLFDHVQKTVIRTPFVCAAHPLPEKYAPMPLGAAKLVAGLVHSGPVGALRLLLRQK
ncbi:NAD-dependent aldehyde dehydrogenase [Micractinium conductrix]|uniref:NAD-dependent aldehyde dehydrogenase n=1 Tax=Micractinium conductrix TaxID=554055 RepID=A0A2P6VBJ7_9CHLO|nr:NAD-dependent aldehyde dehydrogenase [Micractinium conductrix]|eukprot:PSC71464.1 NAD-dependent aldehyde dehydrogenase [Micractinium conductrix]